MKPTATYSLLLVVAALFFLLAATFAQEASPTPQPASTPQVTLAIIKGEDSFGDVLSSLGIGVYGLATLGIAFTAVWGARGALQQYRTQREREQQQRQRELLLDSTKLQGDLVGLLRIKLERVRGTGEEQLWQPELEKAEDIYEGLLRGIMLVHPDLRATAQEAVNEYLKQAMEERQSLQELLQRLQRPRNP